METTEKKTDSFIHKKEAPLPLLGTDHIEFYVSNARQAAHYYKSAFGFQSVAYAGLETGLRDRTSYVVRQGKITLVLTSPLHSNTDIAEHIRKHGDGVKVIAFQVADAETAFDTAVARGAVPYLWTKRWKDQHGTAVVSGIHTYGETVHLFVQRDQYEGVFFPHYTPWVSEYNPESI